MRVRAWSMLGVLLCVSSRIAIAQSSEETAGVCCSESSEALDYSCLRDSMTKSGQEQSTDMTLSVEIREFVENAFHMRFVDRSSVTYSATIFVVREPEEYRGKTLKVFHQVRPGGESIWRKVGSGHSIVVDAAIFDASVFDQPGRIVFATAIRFVCRNGK